MTSRLTYLARTYFHQDFDLEAPTPIGVVKSFVDHETSAAVRELQREIEQLMQASSESDLRRAWLETSDADYDPSAHGMTYREWFEKVLEVLREPR